MSGDLKNLVVNSLNRKILFELVIIAVLLSCYLPTCLAEIPKLDFSSENNGWKIIFSFSEYRAEPSDYISFDIEIHSKGVNYDLRLWIDVIDPIIVESKAEQSELYFSELKIGDVKKESIKITIPDSVEIGEVYSINIRVQSHSNPRGALSQRLPPSLDNPEYTYDSTTDLNYSYNIQIEHYPELSINPDITIFTKGQTTTYKISIKNLGNENAINVVCQVDMPEEFEIIEGTELIEVGDIMSNSEHDIIWKLKPTAEGSYNIMAIVKSSNHKSLTRDIGIKVGSSLINVIITGAIILIIIIAFFAFLFYIITRP